MSGSARSPYRELGVSGAAVQPRRRREPAVPVGNPKDVPSQERGHVWSHVHAGTARRLAPFTRARRAPLYLSHGTEECRRCRQPRFTAEFTRCRGSKKP